MMNFEMAVQEEVRPTPVNQLAVECACSPRFRPGPHSVATTIRYGLASINATEVRDARSIPPVYQTSSGSWPSQVLALLLPVKSHVNNNSELTTPNT